MTQSNVDDQTPDGAADNQSGVSQEKGKSIADQQQNSQEFLALKKQLESVTSELRGLQSRQDKEKNEVQRFMDDVKAQMAKGLSLDEAEQAVTENRKAQEKDDLLFRIAQKVGVLGSPSQPAPAGNGANVTNDAANVLSQYQLDGNDPEVVSEILSLPQEKRELAAAKLAYRRATQPPPSPAAASAMQGQPPKPADVEQLTQQYKTDMLAAQRGSAGNAQRATVKEKYRRLGVPVDGVDFTS